MQHRNGTRRGSSRAGVLLAVLVGLVSIAAAPQPAAPLVRQDAPAEEVEVTDKVLYDTGKRAQGGTVDLRVVFANNPAYMHMKAKGLRETDEQAKPLFAAAKASTDQALREAAAAARVDVVTVPGGVRGGKQPIPDLTQKVVDRLPVYHVDGTVVFGRAQGARNIAQINTPAVLEAIPEYREAKLLTESDARFHILRKKYMDELNRVVQLVARRGGYDAVVELGGVTSRLGPVPNVTATAIAAVDS